MVFYKCIVQYAFIKLYCFIRKFNKYMKLEQRNKTKNILILELCSRCSKLNYVAKTILIVNYSIIYLELME